MAMAGSGDRGALRTAIEGLLRTCVELERDADGTARESRDQVNRVARGLVGLRAPGVSDLAGEIADIGKVMSADVSKTLLEARAPYVAEVHQLLGLLAPLHGVVAVPALSPSGTTADGLRAAFPAGFARDYVGDLLNGVHRSVTVDAEVAQRVPTVPQPNADGVKVSVGAAYSDDHRDVGVSLLRDSICHAVERHGSQIPEGAQLARLIWLKDPSGADAWQIAPDGSVQTNHRCGISAGGFTSPEALAKPIEAFLLAAHRVVGGVDAFLTRTPSVFPSIGIHVSAELAGLVEGDARGYRGAGTGMPETRRDWLAARRLALKRGSGQVHGVPYDPLAEGSDPGATLVFRKSGGNWRLVTCYPVDEPDPRNYRLEDLA